MAVTVQAFVPVQKLAVYRVVPAGNAADPVREAAGLSGYLGAVTLYACLLLAICRRPSLLAALIPVFILAGILFCPIFFDASVFLPWIAGVRKLLPPWWYLNGIF